MVEKCCPRIEIHFRFSDENRKKMWEKTAYVIGFVIASIFPFMWRQPIDPKDELVLFDPDYIDEFPIAFPAGSNTPEDKIELTGINGIQVNNYWAKEHANHLSKILEGRKVTFIHNPTQGWIKDMYRFIRSAFGARVTPSAELLANIWKDKIKQGKTIVHIPHSEGCAITNIALHLLTPEEQQQIYIIGVAPGKYISKDSCKKVFHLVSGHDCVPFFDWYGRLMAHAEGTIKYLMPKVPKRFPDHYIYCETYEKEILDCYYQISAIIMADRKEKKKSEQSK